MISHSPDSCKQRKYPDDMPSASVIMVFYNEAASVVLRTVHSVLNKSPPYLIHEILLYDDQSDLGSSQTIIHFMVDYILSRNLVNLLSESDVSYSNNQHVTIISHF